MRAVARQATKGLLLLLRSYSRPVGVAPGQRQNQAKHNPIKYDAAPLCLLSHQHRVYRSDFNLLRERLLEASGARPLRLAGRCRGLSCRQWPRSGFRVAPVEDTLDLD